MNNRTADALDSPEDLAKLREDLISFYQPINPLERFAVERIALARLSIGRAARLEAGLFSLAATRGMQTMIESQAFRLFLRYQAQAERSHRNAITDFLALKAQRPRGPEPAPASIRMRLVAGFPASSPYPLKRSHSPSAM